MTKLVTTNFKSHVIDALIASITATPNTAYYMFAGEHVNRTELTISTPTDTITETLVDAYRKMTFGKRISSSDVAGAVKNYPYASDKVYTMYDDTDDDLFESEFFTVVDETSYYHVYKCLDNNLGVNSTVQPVFAHISGANSIVYQTSDGYRWKYMYSIPSATYEQFATDTYIPVVANSTVSNSAVYGSIDVIKIEVEGKNYSNYTAGAFATGDVRYGGNSSLYRISNTNLTQTNGYYTGCLIYLSAGTGSGQFKTITDYFTNSNGSFVVVNSVFSTAPTTGTSYEINPRVLITGSGQQTTNAVARCLINSSSTNSIYRVEMLERGLGYDYAIANVVANSVVGVTLTSSLRVIFPPKNGHGYDPMTELGCRWATVGMNFSNNESNTIISAAEYEKIGILKDPLFANVQFEYKTNSGTFINNEKIYKIDPIRIGTNATINTTSNVVSVTASSGDFANQLSTGDYVYLAGSNGTVHQIATVEAITNGDVIEISSVGLFACTETLVYIANTTATAYVMSTANSSDMFVTNVSGQFQTDDEYIGWSSGAYAQVNTVIRNDISKSFNTFIQLYKYNSSSVSGTYTDDEYVTQGNSYGRFHSAVVNSGVTSIYVSEQIGVINTSAALVGNTSLATATLSDAYEPELVFGSGEVLYLENIETVTRSNTQSETFKITFEF